MSEGRRRKEQIKSAAIVVLFTMTILLLYLSWGGKSIEGLMTERREAAEVLPLTQAVLPTAAFLSLGDGSYAACDRGLASLYFASLGELSSGEELLLEEITKEQYLEARGGESIFFDYDYYLPFGEYCDRLGISRIAGSENVSSLSEAMLTAGEREGLFFMGGGTDALNSTRFFRLAADGISLCFEALESERSEALSAIAQEGKNIYYTLDTYLGEGAESKMLMPLSLESELSELSISPEVAEGDSETKDEYAKKFFGNNFDFVRKIEEESGRIIYMYGYGERTLIADAGGSFEYRQEDNGTESLKYFDALERALSFISEHGGFVSLGGRRLTPYLEHVVQDPSGRRGFRFYFGLRAADGANIYYESSAPIVIELISGKVTYFRRDIAEIGGATGEGSGDEFSALNLLAANYEAMAEILARELGLEDAEPLELEDLAAYITECGEGYLRSGESLLPRWIFTLSGSGKMLDFFIATDGGEAAEGAETPLFYRVRGGS